MSRRKLFRVALVDLVVLVIDAVPLATYPATSPLVWLAAFSALCALCSLTLYFAHPSKEHRRDVHR